jgi:citrate lyase subunit beta / citryl-CoA lyase
LTAWRSVLFSPAGVPELVYKALASGADVAVVHLEDAVPAPEKGAARSSLSKSLESLPSAERSTLLGLRINPVGTDGWVEDLALASNASVSVVVIPKIDEADQLNELDSALRCLDINDVEVLGGIETARGVLDVRALARGPLSAIYFGAEDLIADIGGRRTVDGTEALYARSRVALAAHVAGIPAIDQAVLSPRDEHRFVEDAERGRALGFAGKLCIHPLQVGWANAVFGPESGEVDRARRLVAAAEAEAARGRGVFMFEGEMVDEPVLKRAHATLAAAASPTRRL